MHPPQFVPVPVGARDDVVFPGGGRGPGPAVAVAHPGGADAARASGTTRA